MNVQRPHQLPQGHRTAWSQGDFHDKKRRRHRPHPPGCYRPCPDNPCCHRNRGLVGLSWPGTSGHSGHGLVPAVCAVWLEYLFNKLSKLKVAVSRYGLKKPPHPARNAKNWPGHSAYCVHGSSSLQWVDDYTSRPLYLSRFCQASKAFGLLVGTHHGGGFGFDGVCLFTAASGTGLVGPV
jgi:hypothetical protein